MANKDELPTSDFTFAQEANNQDADRDMDNNNYVLYRQELDRNNSLAPGAVMPAMDPRDVLDSKISDNYSTTKPKIGAKRQKTSKQQKSESVDVIGTVMQELYKYKLVAQQTRIQFASSFGCILLTTLCFLLVLADTILIGFGTTNFYFQLQLYVFIGSTVLTGFYHVAIAILMDAPNVSFGRKLGFAFDGPQLVDWTFVVVGWVFIKFIPGVAALRCFRIIRQLWHFDNYYRALSSESTIKPYLFYFALCSRHAIRYFDKLGDELFSSKSRGGLSILGIYFFVTYLFAVVFWLELDFVETSRGHPCRTLSHCYITTMRMSVFDEGGLDFLSAVQEHPRHARYTILFILYIIFASVILMNGLIGAFGYGLVLAIRGKDKQIIVQPPSAAEQKQVDPLLENNNPNTQSVERIGYVPDSASAVEAANAKSNPDKPENAGAFRSMKLGNVRQISVIQSSVLVAEEEELNSTNNYNNSHHNHHGHNTNNSSSEAAAPKIRFSEVHTLSQNQSMNSNGAAIPDDDQAVACMLVGMKAEILEVSNNISKLLLELQDLRSKC